MSNNLLYSLIGFIFGGIIGGGIVGHVCASEYKKRIEALEDENASLRKERNDLKNENLDIREKSVNLAEIRTPTLTEDDFKQDPFIRYEELSKEYRNDDFDKHFETRVAPQDDEEPDIRIISEKEFMENLDYFTEQQNLFYYQADEVLADSNNDPVKNPEDIIGTAAVDLLIQTKRDSIYVANEVDETLYEIIVNHDMSFYRDVMGSGY